MTGGEREKEKERERERENIQPRVSTSSQNSKSETYLWPIKHVVSSKQKQLKHTLSPSDSPAKASSLPSLQWFQLLRSDTQRHASFGHLSRPARQTHICATSVRLRGVRCIMFKCGRGRRRKQEHKNTRHVLQTLLYFQNTQKPLLFRKSIHLFLPSLLTTNTLASFLLYSLVHTPPHPSSCLLVNSWVPVHICQERRNTGRACNDCRLVVCVLCSCVLCARPHP